MAFGIIAGIASIGAGIFGASQADEQADAARAAQQAAIEAQYKYDKKLYDFNWDEALREHRYLTDQITIKRAEEETIGRLKDQMALDQYKYNLAIRDYGYLNQLKQYQESEKIYRKQKSFNAYAAEQAVESERQKLRETVMATAFDNQDMMIEFLQQEGLLQAKGMTGNNAQRQMQSAMAAFGRNQAVLAESLVSAENQFNKNVNKIGLDRYGADIAADANRMIRPTAEPDTPVPYKTPRATFLDPLAPRKSPEPIKGANTAPKSSSLGIVAGALNGIASGINLAQSINPKLFG